MSFLSEKNQNSFSPRKLPVAACSIKKLLCRACTIWPSLRCRRKWGGGRGGKNVRNPLSQSPLLRFRFTPATLAKFSLKVSSLSLVQETEFAGICKTAPLLNSLGFFYLNVSRTVSALIINRFEKRIQYMNGCNWRAPVLETTLI